MANERGVTTLAREPERIVDTPRTPSEGELQAFHQQSGITQDDIAPPANHPLMGEDMRYMDTTRYQAGASGFSTDTGTPPVQYEEIRPEQPAYAPEPAADRDYRQAYGESQNAMGEWRRMAQEQAAQVQQLQQQLADANARLVMTQSQAPVAYQQAAAATPINLPLFANRAPDDIPTAGELNAAFADAINRFAYGEVLPAIQQAQYIAEQQALSGAQRRFGGWDVTPVEEAEVTNKFGWLRRLPPAERDQFVLEHVRALRGVRNGGNGAVTTPYPAVRPQVTQVPQPQAAAPRPVLVEPRSVISKQTFVERAAPVSGTEPQPQLTREQAMAQELAALDAEWRKKGHERAPAYAMKEVLKRHGVNEFNDWGGQSLTR